ncbi:uncharacterized protein LOC124260768 [Haliotis rubra]|uniref:uncharacterized protein LOC124260768 n=1 Tax=Haliotis rubra TaxID=36100 RepID=UPI001EE5802B|nr:uncharacterized protein LOC124260768 [Haliotis rubra]XP_046551040.1 uncharacterized protein LOC124260768 [Haliotis rubra]
MNTRRRFLATPPSSSTTAMTRESLGFPPPITCVISANQTPSTEMAHSTWPPTIFHQLYTIHGMVDGNMFPLVFFFLLDKKEDTYTRMFRLLVDAAAIRGHHLDPQKIQMDHEVASRNPSAIVFPRSEWKGCFFHFTQCVWRRTQQHHLQKAYQDDDEIKRFVPEMCRLAFGANTGDLTS